jgi:hypothetical protein
MTYRERREAKADRLRGWAGKREAKSQAAHARSDELAEALPFGQPIIVGHHSQGRHEALLKRQDHAMRATVDNSRKAEEFNSRADNIDAAAKRAIYSDDPDAIEKLRAKIEKLEHERMLVKQANSAYRTEHKAELKVMTAYQRDMAMPFRSYVLTNLGGTLNTAKKRLTALEASVAV